VTGLGGESRSRVCSVTRSDRAVSLCVNGTLLSLLPLPHDTPWAASSRQKLILTVPHADTIQDTEFPGIVARPIGSFKTGADYHYQTMRCNVDMLKMIQLGVTVSDEHGNTPEVSTWQFNFTFDLSYVQGLSRRNGRRR
jgi:hypothetical protein